MTNRKETLIKLLTGSLVSLEELPAKILQENIYDETGHVDMGMDFKDEYEVLMCFSDKKAKSRINHNNEDGIR